MKKNTFFLTFLLTIIFFSKPGLCGDNNELFTGNIVQKDDGPVKNFRKIFTVNIRGMSNQFPLLKNNRLFIGTDKGYLYCINPANGGIYWLKKLEDKITSPPYIHNSLLYIASGKSIYKINLFNGAVYWRKKTDVEIHNFCGYFKNHVFCISYTGRIFRINVIDGKPSSIHETDLIPSAYGLNEEDTMYIPGENNTLISYDLRDLRVRFTVETEADLISPPLIGKKKIFITGRKKIYAIDKVTGKVIWIRRINIRWFNDAIPIPRYYNERIFLGLRGFDIKTGIGNWIVYGKGKKLTDIFIAGKYLYYGGEVVTSNNGKKGIIQIIDIDSKKRLNTVYINEIPRLGLCVQGKRILFIDKKGVLHGYYGN